MKDIYINDNIQIHDLVETKNNDSNIINNNNSSISNNNSNINSMKLHELIFYSKIYIQLIQNNIKKEIITS